MYRLNHLFTISLYTFVLISCTEISNHDFQFSMKEGGMLQTDSEAYGAEVFQNPWHGVRFDIPYTITNTTDGAVYMIGCKRPSAPVLQKRINGEWISAYSSVEQGCLSPPFIVKPGDQRQDTLRVYGVFPGQNAFPEFLTDVEGEYRLKKKIYSNPETFKDSENWNEQLLPDELRISNSFYVREK